MSQDEALQILSIDDQTEVSKAIQQYFEADGHSVDTASDGVEGLEMASRTSYDVVLLDLLMPKMDGMEFCRRIRHCNKRIPTCKQARRTPYNPNDKRPRLIPRCKRD